MIGRHQLDLARHQLQRHRRDFGPLQADHVIVLPLGEHLGGVGAEARGQDAVVRRRYAAALQMASA